MRLHAFFRATPTAFLLALLYGADTQAQTSGKDSTVVVTDSNMLVMTRQSPPQFSSSDTVPMQRVVLNPFISGQQLIKGNLAGVYVQEPSGEPGTEQSVFVRGISTPMLSKRELFDNQAAIYLNGIPLAQDNPFAYEIQQYDFNRIGPATNLLSILNPNNIESIEVIKDPLRLAALGPVAANGAIWITTKNAHSGYREISVNSYYGMVQAPSVMPVNGVYESNFRLPYYDRYGTLADRFAYPAYLKDSSNRDFYGSSNWIDEYYQSAPVYNVDMSLTGGSDRANFRFFGGATSNAGNADATSLDRYTASFAINVAPVKWINISSMINANQLSRTRNRNFRDRLAEVRYTPDISSPLSPNKNVYGSYLNDYDNNVKDDNQTTAVQGYFVISSKLKGFSYNGRLAFDYNEGTRDVFYPTQMLDGNNFVSNYFGFNQRFIIRNTIGYSFNTSPLHSFDLEAGHNYQNDQNKFDYLYAYNGPNNFIKLNIVEGNRQRPEYLDPQIFTVYYFPSRQKLLQHNFHGKATYKYNNLLKLTALVRRDGASNMQPDNRWNTGYALDLELNGKEKVFSNLAAINAFTFNAGYGRSGKLFSDDRYSAGPAYRPDLSWTGAPTMATYAGYAGLSRPYNLGWVGYGIPWAYSDKINLRINTALLDNRLRLTADWYTNTDRNMLLPLPVAAELGYASAYTSGMEVNNTGVDVTMGIDIVRPSTTNGFQWNFSGNINFNKNKLEALPNGLQELVLGDRKLEVGQSIDAFWVLRNNGIYDTDDAVPVNPATNLPLSYQGLPLKAGDPAWADLNGDYVINNEDKVLTGNALPKVTGGFGSSLAWKAFTLDFQFFFALGHQAMNEYASRRLDFINNDNSTDINSVKEITFWERKMDLSGYPMYNPWSDAVPYRMEQDLFLDDLSFLKLRSLSLGYNLSKTGSKAFAGTFRNAMIYVTGTNLLTFTSFKGDDPELVQYNGIYNGAGLPIPRSFILGVKLDL